MKMEPPVNQTEARSSKRVQAIIALLVHSIAFFGLVVFAFYVLLNTEPLPQSNIPALMFMIILFFATPGIITLWLSSSLYFGKERKKWLRLWAGLCICYGLFYLLMLTRLTDFQSTALLSLILLHILLSLVPAGVILRFTGLSDRKREYHR